MKMFFTADNHFFHKNIIEFESRPYQSVFEMNQDMIDRWNLKVDKCDEVYIIGDFSFGKASETSKLLKSLNGKKHLITGNHDYYLQETSNSKIENLFESIQIYKEIKIGVKYQNNPIDVVLFHYPIADWNKRYHGSWHIYGHVHSMVNYINDDNHALKNKPEENMYNAGADINNFEPVELNELIENNKIWIEKIWGGK
jgi:calcineurin-like phosphoesterase family protein